MLRPGLVQIEEGTGQDIIFIDPHSPHPHLLSPSPGVLQLFGGVASLILGEDQSIPSSLEECTLLCKQIHMKWKTEGETSGDGRKKSGDGPMQYFN